VLSSQVQLNLKDRFKDAFPDFPFLMKCGFTLFNTLTRKTAETGALKTPTFREGPLQLLRIGGPLTENNWTHFVRSNGNSKMLICAISLTIALFLATHAPLDLRI